MPYRRPIRDQHAWSMIHWWPTCLIGDPSETDMPHRRPNWIFLIKYVCLLWVSDKACGCPKRHVRLRWEMSVSEEASRSPMGLRSHMLIFDGSPIRHVNLQWVYDEAYRSPMMLVSLLWCLSVSDEVCRSPKRHWISMGLRWVSDRAPIIKNL